MNPEYDIEEHPDPIAGLDRVACRPVYGREGVRRYVAAVEAEKRRLLAEVRLADERAAAAEERCRVRAEERDALLEALVLAARAEIDRVHTEHRAIISAIHAVAAEEFARIRDRAQAEANAGREVVASLAASTTAGGSRDQTHAG